MNRNVKLFATGIAELAIQESQKTTIFIFYLDSRRSIPVFEAIYQSY